MSVTALGRIVVVHREADARRIVRAIRSIRSCDVFGSLGELEPHLLREPRICGVVAAEHLGHGEAACAVERVRAVAGDVPALLLVERVSDAALVGAYDRRAALLPRWPSDQQLRRFAVDCVVADSEPDEVLRSALSEIANRYRLSAAEVEIVHGGLHGRRAEWFLRERNLSASAYKARVASLLRKSMADDIHALAREIFWRALQRDRRGKGR